MAVAERMAVPSLMRDAWRFRGFIRGSVRRELQLRYLGTQFGAFWMVAQPLATILVYTVVFANLMKPSLPGQTSQYAYAIYLCSGVLTWTLFTDMLNRCVNIFVENATLLKKAQFPKICLPIIVVLANGAHFSIVISLFLAFLVICGQFPGWVVLCGLPVLLVQVAFTAGLGVLLATVNVFYRDVQQFVSVALQFWFWLTPIVYVASVLPPAVSRVLAWNPMWPLIDAYHRIFLHAQAPVWGSLLYPAGVATALLLLGLFAFKRLQGEITDEL
jgi:lipopolysaccharide transport system permease protein